jgi:hypothetical protein
MARADSNNIIVLASQQEADLLLTEYQQMRAMRRAARDTIERLINFLDKTGPDADYEDDGAELEDDDPAEIDDHGIADRETLLEKVGSQLGGYV